MRTEHYSACILLASALLAGCGGATDAQNAQPCSLGSPVGCGGTITPGTPGTPDNAGELPSKAGAVNIVFSSNELASAGLPGSEVTVTALVKTAANTAVNNARIDFSADSGMLIASSPTTDATGKASATLTTGGSMLNRPIKVTVKVGDRQASGVVSVVGTKLLVSGPAFLALGGAADLIATLQDSAGRPIAGAAVSASTVNGNLVQAGAKVSDSKGQVAIRFDASKRGSEQVTLSALGATASKAIMVGGNDVTVTPAIELGAGGVELLAEMPVGSCQPVGGSYALGSGSVTLSASRGVLYRDAGCASALTGAQALVNGNFPPAYIKSNNAGISTIDATITGGPSGSTRVEFVAPLLASSKIKLQPELAVIGSGERSTLIAVVRDGTAANNLVKNATVQFSIVADPSGGTLLAPFSAVTGSDGVARAVFVAGPADGGKDGTVIEARIADLPSATGQTALTVNKKALSIQFGTGNSLFEFSPAVLQQEFAVFVSDSAGNPVRDVAISAAAWPTRYKKGAYEFYIDPAVPTDKGIWRIADYGAVVCDNEDVQRKGLYEAAYDTNNNGTLEPGIPLSVTSSGRTDAMGMATVLLRYPRDRAGWVRLELTVTGSVAGTESVARNAFWLAALAKDLIDKNVSPPGVVSPYGVNSCNMPN